MQHNNNMENHGHNATPIRCTQLPEQPTLAPNSARTRTNQNFPPHYVNTRFSLTPETMGMNVNPVNQGAFKDCQLPAHETPLVDVKSYYERHNIKQLVGNLSDLKLERNTSYQSTQSNALNTSYASIKSEHTSQRVTPQTSPNANNDCQQWNFDNKTMEQRTSSALLCSTQSVQPMTSIVQFTSANPLCGLQVCGTGRKPSEDACLSIGSTQSPAYSCQHSSSATELPTSYFEQQLKKYHIGSEISTGDSAKINFGTLNNMFLKRLLDIETNACGDKDLKLITFQEWVDMLLKITDSFLTNMEELEKEVSERVELAKQKVNTKCRYSQGNELMKCRRDIDTLIKIIQDVYRNKSLNLSGITFETINMAQILPEGENFNMEGNGVIKNCNDSEFMQRNKLLANIKALAHEVAEKHDEVRELKHQIICLEDDIQKAQQKIQFKDDVIKELRNDLKCANHKLSANNQTLEANLAMPPINFENQTARSNNTQISECNTLTFQDENISQFDSLSHTEHEEQQKIKVLEEELNDFFEISKELNKQKMENQRKRLMDIFQAAEAEKAKAYRKLDFIRRQLIDLESCKSEGVNDCDSGFHSKSENDQDAKILDAVRKRLRKLNETNFELKKKLQKLEMENSELSNNLQSEKTFAQRNSETLKQIADLLSGMKTEQFCYTDIYNKTSNEQNPFCEAIIGIKKAFQEREDQLLKVVGLRNKQIEELTNNEKIFHEAKATQMNESLKCQINHLQHTIVERERRIMQLTAMLKGFSHVQSVEPQQAALEYVTSRNNFTAELEKKNEALRQKLDHSMKQERFLHREARKLNEELNESKKKNADLISQINRLSTLLKSQETHRMELAEKYEALEKNYEDQAAKLRMANNQLCMLSERFQIMEKRQYEHNMENNLLREEVLSLKEKNACAMGCQKSMQEQLFKIEKELFTAHNVIKEQQDIMQRNEFNYKANMQRYNEVSAELKRKYNELIEDYKKLQEEHDKQAEINDQQAKLIEKYNKWKEQQLKAESRTREGFKQFEDIIKSLLEEKQAYLDHYWDCALQQSELDRLKVCSYSLANCNALRNNSEKSIAERLEIVRRTTRRVSEHSSSFKDDEAVSRNNSSTPVIPSEEPL